MPTITLYGLWSDPADGRGLYVVDIALHLRNNNSRITRGPISDRLLTARFVYRHGKPSSSHRSLCTH